MAEPDNLVLRILQEIQEKLREHDRRFEQIERRFDQVDTRMDLFHSDLSLKIQALQQTVDGEASRSGFAALGIDQRFRRLEDRVSALEAAR